MTLPRRNWDWLSYMPGENFEHGGRHFNALLECGLRFGESLYISHIFVIVFDG